MIFFEGLTIAVISTAAVAWVHHERGQRRIARQCASLAHLHESLKLVNLLQRHRDIALNQDISELASGMASVQAAISQSIHVLAAAPDIADLARWLAIRDHWQRLEARAGTLHKVACYEQHNRLIENLLMLIEEVAEQAGFTKEQFGDLPNIHLMWRELPWILEYLNQARLLGATGLSTQSGDAATDMCLRGLDKQIRRLSRVTFDRVRYNGPHDEDKSRLVESSMRHCMDFTASLQARLQDTQSEEGQQMQLLRLGTRSVDATQQLLEREMRALVQHVQHN